MYTAARVKVIIVIKKVEGTNRKFTKGCHEMIIEFGPKLFHVSTFETLQKIYVPLRRSLSGETHQIKLSKYCSIRRRNLSCATNLQAESKISLNERNSKTLIEKCIFFKSIFQRRWRTLLSGFVKENNNINTDNTDDNNNRLSDDVLCGVRCSWKRCCQYRIRTQSCSVVMWLGGSCRSGGGNYKRCKLTVHGGKRVVLTVNLHQESWRPPLLRDEGSLKKRKENATGRSASLGHCDLQLIGKGSSSPFS